MSKLGEKLVWLFMSLQASAVGGFYLYSKAEKWNIRDMIWFNEKSWQKKVSKVHGMLGTVFSEELSAKEKTKILEKEESAIKAIYDAALSLAPNYDKDKGYAHLHVEE